MSPRALAAPLHMHTREDEYSFVLQGGWAPCSATTSWKPGPGDLVFKPRNQWHTFWNAGTSLPDPRSSPRPVSRTSSGLSDMGGAIKADPDELAALGERYGLQLKLDSVPELVERFGVRVGEPLSGGWNPLT